MKSKTIETIIGGIVLLIAVAFVFFAYQGAGVRTDGNHYLIKAKFDTIDGLKVGSDVRIGGIKVGVVSKLTLDPNYQAIVEMSVDDNIKVPFDSTAQVVGDGLLGEKFVGIQAGADDKVLDNNGEIKYTQSAVNFETLLGKFIFGSAEKKKEEK